MNLTEEESNQLRAVRNLALTYACLEPSLILMSAYVAWCAACRPAWPVLVLAGVILIVHGVHLRLSLRSVRRYFQLQRVLRLMSEVRTHQGGYSQHALEQLEAALAEANRGHVWLRARSRNEVHD